MPGHGRILTPPDYTPAWWLPDGHTQTLWAALCRPVPRVHPRFERVELPDGDFVDLAHVGREGAPLVLVLHGLEGNYRSPYASALLGAITARGWHGVLMHFRGCSGEPNRLQRSYHSGDTADLGRVANLLAARAPALALVGYSMGGNVLLKYLGERGRDAACATAVAVSVPFDLAIAADTLNRGFARIYQRRLVKSLQEKTRLKFARMTAPIDLAGLARCTDFRSFDHRVTAPLHGFAGVDDYYTRSSCRPFLRDVAVPTRVIHAADDPFLAPAGIPNARELAATVELALVARGGHVGFVATERGWLERRIVEFIAASSPSHRSAHAP
jgi:predicted alpha/beta-fold hydrolase